MPFFGFGKDKPQPSEMMEQVLAYLEDAQRVRTPFLLQIAAYPACPAVLQDIDEANRSMAFHLNTHLSADVDAKVDLSFVFEGLRLSGYSKLLECKAGLARISFPECLENRERRKKIRARLNVKEGATITALTGLFEGTGITGLIENISENGLRVRVERAINIKDEKRLPLGTALLSAGQAFVILKLNKLPRCPAVIECAGNVVYTSHDGGTLVVGIALDKPCPAPMKALIASRAGTLPSGVPPRARRKRPQTEEASVTPDTQTPPSPAVEAKHLAQQNGPTEPDVNQGAVQASRPANQKKRDQAVAVLVEDEMQGERLRLFLAERGYGNILITTHPDELRSILPMSNPGLVFLDGGLPMLNAIALLHQLGDDLSCLPPVILVASEISKVVALSAVRAGASQLLVRPYELDDDLGQMIDQVFMGV